MSYLIFDGINDVAISASVVTRNRGGNGHRYTIKGIYRGDNEYCSAMWNSRGFQLRGDRLRIYYTSSASANLLHTSDLLSSGDTFEYVITVVETSPSSGVYNHTATIEINNSGSPVALTGTFQPTILGTDTEIVLGRRGVGTTFCQFDLERFFYEDLDNSSNNVDLDANATNRTTGTPVLEDQVGSNDATGSAGMPTDGSAWSDLSGPAIVTDNLAQTQTIGNVTLTSSDTISPNGLSQVQTIQEPSLTQAHVLTVNNIAQAQTLEQASLIVAGALAIDSLSQQQTIDNVSLIQQQILSVDGLSQAQDIDNVTIAPDSLLSVAGLLQTQTIDEPTLTQNFVLLVDDLQQAQTIGVVNFGEDKILGGYTISFKSDDFGLSYQVDQITLRFGDG